MRKQVAYGLTQRDVATIYQILRKYPSVKHVCLFGSRINNRFTPGSDIDLAIMHSDISPQLYNMLCDEFVDSNLPYKVDLVDYNTLHSSALKKAIKPVCPSILVYE